MNDKDLADKLKINLMATLDLIMFYKSIYSTENETDSLKKKFKNKRKNLTGNENKLN